MTSSNRMVAGVIGVLWTISWAGTVHAACLDDTQVESLAKAQVSKVPVATPDPLNDTDAACTRTKLHRLMTERGMKVIGYKAGLTNPAVQKRFGADKPVWGRLYGGMLMSNGSAVDAAFGARPLYEADMLVRVSSEDINRATSPAQVLAAIDQIIPFIELPDMLVDAPPKLNGPMVGALNVFAKLGITGTPIAVPTAEDARAALLDSLRDMTILVSDGGGAEIARGRGSDILEHPLNAVVWLAKEVAAEGVTLKRGEVISLGSFSPLLPPKPGLEVTATYQGLTGADPVKVTFK
jgi:2-keto-4-pentenoate hydratase